MRLVDMLQALPSIYKHIPYYTILVVLIHLGQHNVAI